ncbi:MAG: DUF3221 domain-containing protein [Bacilli bacterium]|nr:DUF3221 domain-containing protein [Bacilli bacterium]MBQ7139880.1 DUF3221 domain-containing protein [Bacilli bacterium]
MKTKFNLIFIGSLLLVSVISYFLGALITYRKLDNSLNNQNINYQSFYAIITDIKDTGLEKEPKLIEVKGLDINDINFRGDFEFLVTEATELEWRYTMLEPNELEIGDNIAIIFTGNIEEKDPVSINDVLKIQLLDDKK